MKPRVMSASQVGRYTYCARAWWLEHVQGHEPENLLELTQGIERHDHHGRQVVASQRMANWARGFLFAAIVVAVLLALSLAMR